MEKPGLRPGGGLLKSLQCAPWLDTLSHLYKFVLRVNWNHCEKNRERTYIGDQRSRAEEQRRLTDFSLVLMSRQTSSTVRIRLVSALTKMYSPSEVQRLAFGCDAISGFLRAADKIDAGVGEACLANCFSVVSPIPLVALTEDGDETRRKGGGDA
jgi:hypothetical protein